MASWYRSIITDKLISSAYFKTIELIYGEGTVENLIRSSFLLPVKDPSVIDILRDNGSEVAAAIRYREIHGCTLKEAREGVKTLKNDMSTFPTKYKRYHKR